MKAELWIYGNGRNRNPWRPPTRPVSRGRWHTVAQRNEPSRQRTPKNNMASTDFNSNCGSGEMEGDNGLTKSVFLCLFIIRRGREPMAIVPRTSWSLFIPISANIYKAWQRQVDFVSFDRPLPFVCVINYQGLFHQLPKVIPSTEHITFKQGCSSVDSSKTYSLFPNALGMCLKLVGSVDQSGIQWDCRIWFVDTWAVGIYLP